MRWRPEAKRMRMKLTMIPLLLRDERLSPEIRRAMAEGRMEQAADDLRNEYGLTSAEARALLDLPPDRGAPERQK
jgi:hypothetical protein